MIHRVAMTDLNLGERVARVILEESDEESWAVLLPGCWGLQDVLVHLNAGSAVLRVDGTLTDSRPAGALRAALLTGPWREHHDQRSGAEASDLDIETALNSWAETQRGDDPGRRLPIICVEAGDRLDEGSAAILSALLDARTVRVVSIAAIEDAIPSFLTRLRRIGRLRVLKQTLMTARDLDTALRRYLGAPVSSTVLRRMTALCGGHAALAERVLQAAQATGVLSRDDGPWMWEAEESAFHDELARISTEILSEFSGPERELLIVTAMAGWLPQSWVVSHYGENVLRSLRSQHLLEVDALSSRGTPDIGMAAEALGLMIMTGFCRIEYVRLWYAVGRNIPQDLGGPASGAAIIRWGACAEGSVDGEAAEASAQFGINRAWYEHVIDLAHYAEPARPALRVLAARAHYAMGEVDTAIRTLKTLAAALDPAEAAQDPATLRSAVLLAERMALFHPELSEPVIVSLRELVDEPVTPALDRIRDNAAVRDAEQSIELLNQARRIRDDEESVVAHLWLGAWLGLRRSPDLGRLVLSSLIDEMIREGGFPDAKESAVALLLLITMTHGWRTDVLRVDLQVWNGGTVRGPGLAAVADTVVAIIAMQQDRMWLAFQRASSAARTFEATDPFGLLPFTSAVAAATSSYVAEDIDHPVHQRFWDRFGAGEVAYGPRSLRLLVEGMAAVGSGPATSQVADRLVELAAAARAQCEWAQEQQLLLLAMLGHSEKAAYAVLKSTWHLQPGRSRMIGILAEAMTTSSPEKAVDAAELMIDSDATFFGLSLLVRMWGRQEDLDRHVRIRIVRAVLLARRRADKTSWLSRKFDDLTLDSRETRVLKGLEAGESSREIAARLHLSPRTVEATISGMFQRFSCVNRMELLSLGLLQHP